MSVITYTSSKGTAVTVPTSLFFTRTTDNIVSEWKIRTRFTLDGSEPALLNDRAIWDLKGSIHHSICWVPPSKGAEKGKWLIANLLSPVADGEIPPGIVHNTSNATPLNSEADMNADYEPPYGMWGRWSATGRANEPPSILSSSA